MIYLPVILFAIAAVGGLTMVIIKYGGKAIPLPLAALHGILAAAGLVALIYNVAQNTSSTIMNVSLVLFLIVAVGGFILLSFHLRSKPHPDSLIAIHGAGAVISFVLLLVASFR
jgi:hypothetical protein